MSFMAKAINKRHSNSIRVGTDMGNASSQIVQKLWSYCNILRDDGLHERAFEGRVVPQDPADEPASALLDRIRGERAPSEQKAAKAGRNPKRSRVRQRDEVRQSRREGGSWND